MVFVPTLNMFYFISADKVLQPYEWILELQASMNVMEHEVLSIKEITLLENKLHLDRSNMASLSKNSWKLRH